MAIAIQNSILEQPIAFTSDKQSGLVTERRWVGLHNAVLGQAVFESNFADSIRFESHGAAASLMARYGAPQDGGTEILTTQFEMRGEEITQSVWKHPYYSGLPKNIQKATRDAADSVEIETADLLKILAACKLAYPEVPVTGTSALASSAFLAARDVYWLLLEGTDSYLVDQSYVFIRTRTGSRNYQAVLEFQNDGRIWSSAQVAAYVGDPAPFNVPQLDAVPNSEQLLLAFGWRKRPTDVVRISNGNQQITESWQSARWTLLLYQPASF